jgi:putative FmdB family regulatory protein
MPLYEYQCDACGHRFESIQKFSDPPIETCPKCGGAVRKLQSAPAFQFKGSGWYITDYAKKDQPAANSETGAKETETAGKDTAAKKDAAVKAEKTEKAGTKSEAPAKSVSPGSSTAGKDT